jgi:hypothetical protein
LDERSPSDEQELRENFLSWDELFGIMSGCFSWYSISKLSVELSFLIEPFMGVPCIEAFLTVKISENQFDDEKEYLHSIVINALSKIALLVITSSNVYYLNKQAGDETTDLSLAVISFSYQLFLG